MEDNLRTSSKSKGSWNLVWVYLSFNISSSYSLSRKCWTLEKLISEHIVEQAGTELGQAQLKLGLDFTLIFCRFGSPICIDRIGLIEYIWFVVFGFSHF